MLARRHDHQRVAFDAPPRVRSKKSRPRTLGVRLSAGTSAGTSAIDDLPDKSMLFSTIATPIGDRSDHRSTSNVMVEGSEPIFPGIRLGEQDVLGLGIRRERHRHAIDVERGTKTSVVRA